MSLVLIDYDMLNQAAINSNRAADRISDYINDLARKVSRKYSSLEGGASAKTSNSQYYIERKSNKLSAKRDAYNDFATDLRRLSNKAQEVDKDVAQKIKASKDEFINKHDYIDTNWWTELKEWFIDMKNKCPLFEAISTLIQGCLDEVSNLFRDLKHWYECGGGKELIGVVLAVAGAVVAVVIAVCAVIAASGFVAICAAVAAVIGAISAVVNVVTSIKAKNAKDRGDPAWAKVYSDQDTIQDYLRAKNFNDGFLNKFSYITAGLIDVTEAFCAVVSFVDGIGHIKDAFKNIKEFTKRTPGNSLFSNIKSYVFNTKGLGQTEGFRYFIQKSIGKKDYINRTQQVAKQVSGIAKQVKNGIKFAENYSKYTLTGDWSIKNIAKGFHKEIKNNIYTLKAISQVKDFYQKNLNSLYKSIRGGTNNLNWRSDLPGAKKIPLVDL